MRTAPDRPVFALAWTCGLKIIAGNSHEKDAFCPPLVNALTR